MVRFRRVEEMSYSQISRAWNSVARVAIFSTPKIKTKTVKLDGPIHSPLGYNGKAYKDENNNVYYILPYANKAYNDQITSKHKRLHFVTEDDFRFILCVEDEEVQRQYL
eukprot:TRINITY_DN5443_c1_g4_i3.p1 TRINITY_DN5443_c1_g4~~TRINITY_DN5443_c1_g4_i3.p1  ORF type:complete len:109 (-),score=14.76 TRINITY_DN5443_c1_g4_i3:94-420(-)